MNKKNKFLSWINGFRKIDYVVPLLNKPKLYNLPIDVMGSTLGSISSQLAYYPIKNVTFGIDEFTAEKEFNSEIRENLIEKKSSISYVKACLEYVRRTNVKEMRVTSTVYCLGLDYKVWKFTFKSYMIYSTWVADYDSDLINLCVEYINGWIKAFNLEKMCLYPINCDMCYDYKDMHTRHFDGWIKTFCNPNEYSGYGLDEIFNDLYVNDAQLFENVIMEENANDYLQKNSMTVDVIRRNENQSIEEDLLPVDLDIRTLSNTTIDDIVNNELSEVS